MDIYLEYAVVMDSTIGEVQMDLTWNILWPWKTEYSRLPSHK